MLSASNEKHAGMAKGCEMADDYTKNVRLVDDHAVTAFFIVHEVDCRGPQPQPPHLGGGMAGDYAVDPAARHCADYRVGIVGGVPKSAYRRVSVLEKALLKFRNEFAVEV